MRYELIEITSDGFVSHRAETAEQALSLWYALDGDVQTIKDELQQEVGLAELRAAATTDKAYSKIGKQNSANTTDELETKIHTFGQAIPSNKRN